MSHKQRLSHFLVRLGGDTSMPAKVNTGEPELRLLAVWAFHNYPSAGDKRLELDEALAAYLPFLSDGLTLVVRDLNPNPVWGRARRPGFSPPVDLLYKAGLSSAWHRARRGEQGRAGWQVLQRYGRPHRAYWIDYCFASSEIEISAAEIASPERWLALSHHLPLVIDLRPPWEANPDGALAELDS